MKRGFAAPFVERIARLDFGGFTRFYIHRFIRSYAGGIIHLVGDGL